MAGGDNKNIRIHTLSCVAGNRPVATRPPDALDTLLDMRKAPFLDEGTYHAVDIAAENSAARKQAAIGCDRSVVASQRVLLQDPALKMLEVIRQQAHLGRRHIDAMRGVLRIIGKPGSQAFTRLEYEELTKPQRLMSQQVEGNCRSGYPAANNGDNWKIVPPPLMPPWLVVP